MEKLSSYKGPQGRSEMNQHRGSYQQSRIDGGEWNKLLASSDHSSPTFIKSKQQEAIVSVKLSPAKLDQLRARYRYALLAKVLFRKIRIDHLYKHLLRLWSPKGNMNIHEHANDFFVIVLSDPLDYLRVLRGPVPWMISGHYITLQPFVFNFKPWETAIKRTPIWVRLPEYPIELYDDEVFKMIAEAMGGCLRSIHSMTRKLVRVKFARLCIEVDLSQPLPLCIEICGRLQQIEYEGLHMMCSLCRRAGHFKEDCTFYAVQPDLASQDSSLGGSHGNHEAESTQRQAPVRNKGKAIREFQVSGSHYDPTDELAFAEDSSGSSDLLKEATTRYLQPGEGTSSSEIPVEDTSQSCNFPKDAKTRHFQCGEGNSSFVMNAAIISSDEHSSRSSDFLEKVSTKHRQPGESTSSVMMNVETPLVEENFNPSNPWREPVMRHLSLKHPRLLRRGEPPSSFAMDGKPSSKLEDISPTLAKGWELEDSNKLVQGKYSKSNLVSGMPSAVAASRPSTSVPTRNTNNDSCQLLKTLQVNPLSQSLATSQSKVSQATAASQFYVEAVKKSVKHKEINAESLHVIDLNKEPIILSTKSGFSSIQSRFSILFSSIQSSFSISHSSACKTRITVTPNELDLNHYPNPMIYQKKLLCWTCGGADDTRVAQAINELVKTHKPSILFLSDTSPLGSKTWEVINDSQFSGNPEGSFGGMWLWWRKEEVKVDIQSADLTHINAMVEFLEDAPV